MKQRTIYTYILAGGAVITFWGLLSQGLISQLIHNDAYTTAITEQMQRARKKWHSYLSQVNRTREKQATLVSQTPSFQNALENESNGPLLKKALSEINKATETPISFFITPRGQVQGTTNPIAHKEIKRFISQPENRLKGPAASLLAPMVFQERLFLVSVSPLRTPRHIGWLGQLNEIDGRLYESIGLVSASQILFQTKDQIFYNQNYFEKELDKSLFEESFQHTNSIRSITLHDTLFELSQANPPDELWHDPNSLIKTFFLLKSSEVRLPPAFPLGQYLLLMLLAATLSLLVTFFAAHRTSQPLTDLIFAFSASLQNRISKYPKINSDDERAHAIESFKKLGEHVRQESKRGDEELKKLINLSHKSTSATRELKLKLREKSLLLEITNAINYMTQTKQILGVILERILTHFHFERASVMLYDKETSSLQLSLVRTLDLETSEVSSIEPKSTIQLKYGEGIAGTVLQNGKPMVIDNAHENQDFKQYKNEYDKTVMSLICVPLSRRRKPFGIINISTSKPKGVILQSDLHLLMQIANQAALNLQNAKLYNSSIIDLLTRTYNRRYFLRRLESETTLSRRTKQPLALMLIDIDHFSQINESFGQTVGDHLLYEIGYILQSQLRKTDIICRYDADQFAVLMVGAEQNQALQVSEKLRTKIQKHEFETTSGPTNLSVTVGLSFWDSQWKNSDTFLELAIDSLIKAKQRGRNITYSQTA